MSRYQWNSQEVSNNALNNLDCPCEILWSTPDFQKYGAPLNDDVLKALTLGSATIEMEGSELILKKKKR